MAFVMLTFSLGGNCAFDFCCCCLGSCNRSRNDVMEPGLELMQKQIEVVNCQVMAISNVIYLVCTCAQWPSS